MKAWCVLATVLGLTLGARSHAFGSGEPLRLDETQEAADYVVSARNNDPYAVRWVWVSFNAALNAYAVPPLPAGFVLRPLERRRLFTIKPLSGGGSYSFGLSELSGEGDPTREPDPHAVYLLPYAHGTKHLISQGYFGRISHQGLYALDFAMPDGTAIDAARAGVVIAVKQDSNVGGASAAYANDGNYIEVMHADATWAIYAHLRQGGARVGRGQRVGAGQEIGLSGHTGEATGPHLHFAVYRAGWGGPRTIPTVFLTGPSSTASLEEGHTYYSYHPGGAPFVPVLGENLSDADFRGITRTARGSGVSVRYDLVDRRNFVWADNNTDHDIDLSVDVQDGEGVRPSVGLPFQIRVPARTEVYCFHIDYVGEGSSSFRLSCSWTGPRN